MNKFKRSLLNFCGFVICTCVYSNYVLAERIIKSPDDNLIAKHLKLMQHADGCTDPDSLCVNSKSIKQESQSSKQTNADSGDETVVLDIGQAD